MDTPNAATPATPNPSAIAERSGVYRDRVDEWVYTLSAAELWSQLNRVSIWFKLAAFAAFIASSFFVVGYFAGSLQVQTWNTEQWLHGLVLGVPFTATLTMFQYFLYSSGNKKAAYSSALSFIVAAGFGIMTEIGQGMERQENRVHERSLQSPVLQSALKAIENSTAPSTVRPVSRDAVEKLAYHQYELARCDRHRKTHGQWRVDKCVNYEQQRIARYQAVVDSQSLRQQQELSAQAGKTAQLLQTAKQLERDEKHYHAFIRFLHSLLGFDTYLSANFILSLLLVMAFEYAFHYLGNFERDTKAALRIRGYEVKRFRAKPPAQKPTEQPPTQRTLQNHYMPMQQVGFDPLRITAPNSSVTAANTASTLQTAPQQKRTAPAKQSAESHVKPAAKTAANPSQHQAPSKPLIPSSFSSYLGKALQTGTANTPQEVQQFLHSAGVSVGQKSESGNVKSAAGPLLRKCPGCTRTVGVAEKSESGQGEKVKPEVGQGTLSAELQTAADQLYALWKQQILHQQIKPTFRPGKVLLNQHLCQDKRRQTPTPLEMDNITQQWFVRALQEQVILPNNQQGRGHARYRVNPDKVLT